MSFFPEQPYSELSASAQTAFANIEGAARFAELERTIASVSGSFSSKTVKNTLYWYYQVKDPDGRPKQIYLGPSGPQIDALMAKRKDPKTVASAAHLSALADSAIALGCTKITPKHGRVIRRIAEYGFFRAGGVLAGTHAFLAYQNMLGVKWKIGDTTMDLDFAHPGKNVSVAFPDQIQVDVMSALESLQMGFLPVHGQARFKKDDEPDFDVDFLTVKGRSGEGPVLVESLGITLQPLKFMELAFERPEQAVLLLNDGPLVVTTPRPEYFALHKLIVSEERKNSDAPKSNKDLAQAVTLMTYFLDHNPQKLRAAFDDVMRRGPGWRKRIDAGMLAIERQLPAQRIQERLLGNQTHQIEDSAGPFETDSPVD